MVGKVFRNQPLIRFDRQKMDTWVAREPRLCFQRYDKAVIKTLRPANDVASHVREWIEQHGIFLPDVTNQAKTLTGIYSAIDDSQDNIYQVPAQRMVGIGYLFKCSSPLLGR